MKKLDTKYVQHQTISASHLCIVNSLVLFRNLSKAFYLALFLKENRTFSRHLKNEKKKKRVILTIIKKNQNTPTGF